MPHHGYSWSCSGCGADKDGFAMASWRDNALVAHARRCRELPSGTEVRSTSGRLLYRKP